MKSLLLLLLFSHSLFAQTVCEERTPVNQPNVFRWIMSVTKSDNDFVSDTYFYGKKPGQLSEREMGWSLVGFFTDEHYDVINQVLRAESKPQVVTFLADAINQSLCDFPVFEGDVYRGATLPQTAIDEYVEKEKTAEKENRIIMLKSFTSTSKKDKVGCDFAGNVIYKIISRQGRVIEEASLKKFEKEVLFHKRTTFEVTLVSTDKDLIRTETNCKKKGLTLIKMTEL